MKGERMWDGHAAEGGGQVRGFGLGPGGAHPQGTCPGPIFAGFFFAIFLFLFLFLFSLKKILFLLNVFPF